MRSRARFAGHSIHPILIVFPLGLLVTAVVFDGLFFITASGDFAVAGAYTTAAGVIGGVVASLFGWIDWLGIPARTRAKRVGLLHGAGNTVVLALFAVGWLLRPDRSDWEPTTATFLIAFAGLLLAGWTGWLGGELVERLGVGVDEEADLDAPSSLDRTATR